MSETRIHIIGVENKNKERMIRQYVLALLELARELQRQEDEETSGSAEANDG